MRKTATVFMALFAAGSLTVAGIYLVAGVIDIADPFSGLYFTFAAGAAILGGFAALTARGLWRDRVWAWSIFGLLGAVIALGAYQINQAFYGDGSLVSLTPITPYLAPVALAGLALVALAAARAFAGRRDEDHAAS